MKIFVLLPAYNEELSLPTLLPKIADTMKSNKQEYTIIVGNDGSSDKTNSILQDYQKSLPLEIVTHKINRGLGETSRDLFERAGELSGDDDIIVRMDCDDTHEPEFIPSLADKLNEGFDVVIASRFQPGGGQKGVSGYRAFISRCANLFMKFFFPIKGIQEYSCGFRGYKASFIRKAVAFYGNDFAFY